MNGLLESRMLGNPHVRFGGGWTEKALGASKTSLRACHRGTIRREPRDLAGRLPYKDQEQRHDVGLLKYLNHWGKLQEFPSRMVEWDNDQVAAGYAEACRKLQSLQAGRAEAYEEALAN